jgi:sucrose-6-phosphate hydrolase SacC (GH32 family)
MVSSESRDLLNWDCAPKEYNVPPGDDYKQRRDPYVFWIPEMKGYGCVMTTWMKDSSSRMTGGALSLATSPDLKTWTDHGAVIYPGDMGPPECPQMFTLGGRWYALASITVILWWQDSRHAKERVASQCTVMAREQAFRWHASAPWDGRAREIAGEMNGIS